MIRVFKNRGQHLRAKRHRRRRWMGVLLVLTMLAALCIFWQTHMTNTVLAEEEGGSAPTELGEYLKEIITVGDTESARGFCSLLLLDENDVVLQTNDDGNYEVETGKDYKVQFAVSAYGIEPGTYTYQLPAGITYTACSGQIKLSGTETVIADWTVDEGGKIEFVFNEEAETAQDIAFNFTVRVTFEMQIEEIPFEGQIDIVVKEPEVPTPILDSHVSKSAVEGDDGYIYWTINVRAGKDYDIEGMVIKDLLATTKNQTLVKQNIKVDIYEAGYYTDTELTEEERELRYHHYFTIYYRYSTKQLKWTENDEGDIVGWSYILPAQIHCTRATEGHICADEDNEEYVELSGDMEFQFSVKTKKIVNSTGPWENKAITDWGEDTASIGENAKKPFVIDKKGILDTSTEPVCKWTATIDIPAIEGGVYCPYISDSMCIAGENNTVTNIDQVENYIQNLKVTAMAGDNVYDVKEYTEAEEDEPYGIHFYTENDSFTIEFYKRCDCIETNCNAWDEAECVSRQVLSSHSFCKCWNNSDQVSFVVTYETPMADIISQYGGLDQEIRNTAEVGHKIITKNTNGEWEEEKVKDADAAAVIDIPRIIKKENTEKPTKINGWTASFKIIFNETKEEIYFDENGLRLEDQMTETLVYVVGTMNIIAEDANGTCITLRQEEYDLAYEEETHLLTVVIKKPGSYQYTVMYDAVVSIPTGSTDQTYSNSASVSLWGRTYTSEIQQTSVTNWDGSAESYSIFIHKIAADNVNDSGEQEELSGAKFGLYAFSGIKIDEGITNEEGEHVFMTDIVRGIIFYRDTPYYIQELTAPAGYRTDKTKRWFFFDGAGEDPVVEGASLTRYEGTSNAEDPMEIINYAGYELPESGGAGTLRYTFGGLLLIAAGLLMYKNKGGGGR